jgi:DNA-binding Xre family transcriptional regulator
MVKIHLAELLGKKKWSRADLSKVTGIRYNTINDLYYEISLGIRFEHLEQICNALECN